MNAPENPAQERADTAPPAPTGRTNPKLTANLQADYEAVRNDLEQAQELAADFQRQVADKSNEVAHIKRLLEKSAADLARLEGHVGELRQERHRLANELMLASAMELELTKVKRERDQLRKELETIRETSEARIMELQAQVMEQRAEINELESICKNSLPAGLESMNEPAMQKINELTDTVAKLMSMVEGRAKVASHSAAVSEVSEDGIIDIPFER